jgi:hypothetical protein
LRKPVTETAVRVAWLVTAFMCRMLEP